MELTKQEQALIKAVRALNEPPANILLWYVAGVEGAMGEEPGNSPWAANDARKIAVAREYMRDM